MRIKKKYILIITVGLLLILSLHILFSTMFINEDRYVHYAAEYLDKNGYINERQIIDWSDVSVTKGKLPPKRNIFMENKYSGNLNKFLLNLNGNRTVIVTFKTNLDGLLGPIVVYYNPFTKQVIGMKYRF